MKNTLRWICRGVIVRETYYCLPRGLMHGRLYGEGSGAWEAIERDVWRITDCTEGCGGLETIQYTQYRGVRCKRLYRGVWCIETKYIYRSGA